MSGDALTPGPEDAPTEVSPPVPRDDGFDFDLDSELPPPPPRRRRTPVLTAALELCAAVGIGVLGGILIEKHWGGGSGGGNGGGRAAAFAALAGRGGQSTGSGGSPTGPAGGGAFARAGTVGQVKAVAGRSLYVTDLQGNVVKVTTAPGTKVRVTSDGTLRKIHPGDYVTVQGPQTATGYSATSITDSGTESPFGAGAGFGGFGGGGTGSSRGTTGTSGGGTNGGGTSTGGGTANVPALPGLGGG